MKSQNLNRRDVIKAIGALTVSSKLAGDAVITLDDADRRDETRIAQLWLEQYRELSRDEARCGNRFLVLRRD